MKTTTKIAKAFQPAPWLEFDRGGKSALTSALRSLRSRDDRRMIVVQGPSRSGKTTLVRSLLESFYGDSKCLIFPAGEPEMQRLLDCLVSDPFAWFEDAPRYGYSRSLCLFLQSSQWSYRALFKQNVETVPLFTRVFLTTCFELDEDIARRSIIIRLKAPEGSAR